VDAALASRWQHRSVRRADLALAVVAALLLLVAVVAFLRPSALPLVVQQVAPASSCEQWNWPPTEISCIAARNTSVTALIPVEGQWTVRVWLTTLGAVDAVFAPRQQVADHPATADAPVWLFIYENANTGDRVLHVAAASNARPGAFVYVYPWSDLGSPQVPATMPAVR
jgi:hypothetical protein